MSCYNLGCPGEVRVLDKQGKLKQRLGRGKDGSSLIVNPNFITVNKAGDKIFVSDCGSHTITCMKVDGSIVYQYKDNGLREPMNLFCDDGDNVMGCDLRSNNLHVISSDGKMHGTLSLSSQSEMKRPMSVAYRKNDNTLVVGCSGPGHMLVCQLAN